jgi:pimeloyl-ACP methyl ester carboxylesterase
MRASVEQASVGVLDFLADIGVRYRPVTDLFHESGGECMRLARLLALVSVALSVAVPIASPAHEANYPIIMVHGWTSSGSTFDEMIPKLTAQGLTVVDCDASKAGIQALSYAPTSGSQHLSYLAGKILQPKIDSCLTTSGYSTSQKIDIVSHSMGGLTSRFLIEKGGADVDYWSSTTGWYGDGIPDVSTKWKAQVDDLIILGTPNHGTILGWFPSTLPVFGAWSATGGDMRPNSKFLQLMGYAEPVGETYSCGGGNPWYLQLYQSDFDGDGITHGFDGVVPAESPFLTGCNNALFGSNHSGLRTDDAPIDWVIQELGYTSTQTGTGGANLAGQATIKLEYFHVVQDHDNGTTDDYKYEIQVDADGNNDGYTTLQTLSGAFDGPAVRDWGNSGPGTSVAVNLPGTSPRMDVRVRVWEDDTSWGGGQECVSTHTFTNITQSEDIDGLENYVATASDCKGGTNTLKVSVYGVTSDTGQTRMMTFGFDKAYIQSTHEPCCNAEVQFTAHVGRVGYLSTFYRGQPGNDSHYSRSANTWVNIGTDANNKGTVESEVIWKIRMLNSATFHMDIEYWEDDGGWSSRDGGNSYYVEGNVGTKAAGRTNYTGTAHGDWDGYFYITAEG